MPVLLRFDRARYEMALSCSRLGSRSPSCAISLMAFVREDCSPPADYPCAPPAARNAAASRLSAKPPFGGAIGRPPPPESFDHLGERAHQTWKFQALVPSPP